MRWYVNGCGSKRLQNVGDVVKGLLLSRSVCLDIGNEFGQHLVDELGASYQHRLSAGTRTNIVDQP